LDEDVLPYTTLGLGFRIHLVRVQSGEKGIEPMRAACDQRGIAVFAYMTGAGKSDELADELAALFENAVAGHLTSHIVVMVKGHLRRANELPNSWKLKVGAVMELYTSKPDTSVQIQGLVGRMTGYWREAFDQNHVTGPFRTSIKAIREYEDAYSSHLATYTTARKDTMLEASQVGFVVEAKVEPFVQEWFEYKSLAELLARHPNIRNTIEEDAKGFVYSNISKKKIVSTAEIVAFQQKAATAMIPCDKLSVGGTACRKYICYDDLADNTTIRYFVKQVKRIK
jgi:hypothetical protein